MRQEEKEKEKTSSTAISIDGKSSKQRKEGCSRTVKEDPLGIRPELAKG